MMVVIMILILVASGESQQCANGAKCEKCFHMLYHLIVCEACVAPIPAARRAREGGA